MYGETGLWRALRNKKYDVAKMMMTDFTPDMYVGGYQSVYPINGLISSCNVELFKIGVTRGLINLDGKASKLGKPLLFALFDNNWVQFSYDISDFIL